MFKINFEDAGVLGVIGGIGALAWAFIQTKRMKDTANKINMSLEDVAKKTPVDIQKAFLDAAVEKAVNREVEKNVQKQANVLGAQIRGDMDKMIRDDVSKAYGELQGKVTEKVDSEINKISIDPEEIKRDVKEKLQARLFRELFNSTGFGKLFSGSDGKGGNGEYLYKALELIPWSDRKDAWNNYWQNQ